jgi:hypothetical protein
MIIIIENNNRILIKDNKEKININDGSIIQYTGIYYKIINDIIEMVKIETTFIGSVECDKYIHYSGICGIYVKPLYIWDKINNEWKKIINYKPPTNKYFLYPHLLIIPTHLNYGSYQLYFLDTCINKSLDEFINITTTITLHVPF